MGRWHFLLWAPLYELRTFGPHAKCAVGQSIHARNHTPPPKWSWRPYKDVVLMGRLLNRSKYKVPLAFHVVFHGLLRLMCLFYKLALCQSRALKCLDLIHW